MPQSSFKAVTYTGISPQEFAQEKIKAFVNIANEEGLQLESELVESTPANFGRLKGGWVFTPATEAKPRAIVNQSVSYFLTVEMGRAKGKGISKEGQVQVARWAKLVLGLKDQKSKRTVKKQGQVTSKTFAYLLSQKYKREGRPAVGFVGLATPGKVPSKLGQKVPDNLVPGSLLDVAFKRIKARVDRL
jgi:hypothetical protein